MKEVGVFLATNRFNKSKSSYYAGFSSYTFIISTSSYIEIVKHSILILKKIFKKGLTYKKAGVTLSNLSLENEYQTSYLISNSTYNDNLMKKIDYINDRFGMNKVCLSSQNIDHKLINSKKKLSPKYMNSWKNIPNIKI